ncbi:alpha/beta fold hydrolase [Streptomyces sp. NPDC005202]|uniref:alpha/beta fold hydrolase n=1 Tax=Streptomyces sp. NPDC005202 TaxID=3157021 RepID=UPI00339E5800
MTDPYFDVRGDGPVLLVLPGGAGHPMGLDPMTEHLARRFTVVTYDPLGLAHGRLGRPVADQRVEEWSDGARQVLDAVLPEGAAAHVLGTSSGGIAALDLLARHPGRLRYVVAHEPPCVAVLPDGARQRERFREVYDTYRTAGPHAAGARLAALLEGREPGEARVGQPLSRAEELSSPMAVFLAHVLVPFTSYVPELDASPARLTLAAGVGSRGQLLHRTATFLAERTGGGFAGFPGGHLGAVEYPEAFAKRLAGVLDAPDVSRGHCGMSCADLQES